MRLWTLHPRYLDARGLVALWREALLAQAVLAGNTRGYTQHPQLARFRTAPQPGAAIAAYLRAVHAEAVRRGYAFDGSKIVPADRDATHSASDGQLEYEWTHLKAKLQARAPAWLLSLQLPEHLETHPLFHLVPGPVAAWEIRQPAAAIPRQQKSNKAKP
jgi:hypothetical protein